MAEKSCPFFKKGAFVVDTIGFKTRVVVPGMLFTFTFETPHLLCLGISKLLMALDTSGLPSRFFKL